MAYIVMVCIGIAYTVMAYIVMAYTVMAYIVYGPYICGLFSYGLYSYGMYRYGPYRRGLFSYGLHSYGLDSYLGHNSRIHDHDDTARLYHMPTDTHAYRHAQPPPLPHAPTVGPRLWAPRSAQTAAPRPKQLWPTL